MKICIASAFEDWDDKRKHIKGYHENGVFLLEFTP